MLFPSEVPAPAKSDSGATFPTGPAFITSRNPRLRTGVVVAPAAAVAGVVSGRAGAKAVHDAVLERDRYLPVWGSERADAVPF
jgi:hypothetical protein